MCVADNSNIIGSGTDTIVLTMSGDSAVGTAPQFTVNVDGQQIGGLQTVTAAKDAGEDQTFTFQGNYAPGPHEITVTFSNNFLLPDQSGDRNLYIDGVTYDGQTVSSSTTPVYQSPVFPPNSTQGDILGNATFSINDTTTVPSDAQSTPTTTPSAVDVGSGADTLVLNMAEDSYEGDAQFTVSVDGKQVGGTLTTTAEVEQGQQQAFDVHGDWGSGTHTVSVTFTNDKIGDLYPGTDLAVDTTDRNLYVMGASLDGGTAVDGLPWELSSDGSTDFSVTAGSDTSSNATITSDSLTTGSSTSGMSFVASTSTGDSSAATDTSASSSDSETSSSTALTVTTPTTQDWSTPSTSSSGDISQSSDGGSHWWTAQSGSGQVTPTWHHHG
jgi:uncharacterized protein YdeI (BOF family)